MIRIVVADDHALLRESLTLMLKAQPDLDVVREASNGVEALEAVRDLHPDVLLMDIAMPRMNGLDTIQFIKQESPETKVIILSMFEKDVYVHQALNAGASGYVVKSEPSADLLDAIRKVNGGKRYLSPTVQATGFTNNLNFAPKPGVPKTEDGFYQLSDREKEVFHLLVQGNSSSQIGEILCISSKTADKHRANIAHKIGIDNPVKMVHYAIKIGLLDPSFWTE